MASRCICCSVYLFVVFTYTLENEPFWNLNLQICISYKYSLKRHVVVIFVVKCVKLFKLSRYVWGLHQKQENCSTKTAVSGVYKTSLKFVCRKEYEEES